MRLVTREEAQFALERLRAWAKSGRMPSGGSLGPWLFAGTISSNELPSVNEGSRVPGMIDSIASNAVQTGLKYPCTFACCPQESQEEPLRIYQSMLVQGVVILQNVSVRSNSTC